MILEKQQEEVEHNRGPSNKCTIEDLSCSWASLKNCVGAVLKWVSI